MSKCESGNKLNGRALMNLSTFARTSLTLLKAYDATARHLSFSRAATELGRSQATLSTQVRELENRLQIRLMDRTTRRISLTEAGETLAHALRDGFESIAVGLTSARDIAKGRQNRVSIGCVPSIACTRLPAILGGYPHRDTLTELEIKEMLYRDIVKAVSDNKVDFAIGPCSNPPPDNITFTRAVDDPLCLVLRARDLTSTIKASPLQLLETMPLILLRSSLPLQQDLKKEALAQGVQLKTRIRVGQLPTAIGMVRAGFGVAAAPRLALPDVLDSELVALPILDPPILRTIGILTGRGRELPAAAAKLVRYITSDLAKVPRIQIGSGGRLEKEKAAKIPRNLQRLPKTRRGE
jgi:DNA-binding transcriptional LysR family regulator